MRASLGTLGVISTCLFSTSALAYSAGNTRLSGKDGMTCSSCHTGGSAPTVELTGPTTLAPNATGQYTLIIKGGAAKVGGMNVAVDNTAAVLQPGAGVNKVGNELTHSAPKAFGNGEVRFDFSLVAPASGTVKIFGAGNSANGNGIESGDNSATVTQTVTVSGGTTPPTEPDKDEEKGGCSATGGSPMLAFALAAATLTRLRRRQG